MKKHLKKYSLLFKDAFLSSLFCLFFTFILSLIVLNLSFLNPFKEAFKDFSFSDLYYAEKIQETSINKDIILINIEKRDRTEIAILLESILLENPKIIGIDAIFKDLKDTEGDINLTEVLNDKKIISAINFEEKGIIKNHPFFDTKNEGFININFDGSNKVIRTFDAFQKSDSSFTLKIASKFGEKIDTKKLRKNQRIKYTGNYKSFIHFGFDEFMISSNKNIVKNKIVLLGYLGTPIGSPFDVEDKFFTPLNKTTSGKSLPDMFGVVVHANILKMFLENDFIYEVSNFWVYLITYLFVFLFMVFQLILERKGEIYNRTLKWLVIFLFTVILLYIHLLLYSKDIYLNVFYIIAITAVCSNLFIFYVHFIKFLNTKIKWKSYILQK